MEGKIVSGWWSLDFDGQQYHYNIFQTEEDARVNLLI